MEKLIFTGFVIIPIAIVLAGGVFLASLMAFEKWPLFFLGLGQ